jgi:hypothetical protein
MAPCRPGAGEAKRVARRRRGRVAEGGALLRRYTGTLYRGFESLRLRQQFAGASPARDRPSTRDRPPSRALTPRLVWSRSASRE